MPTVDDPYCKWTRQPNGTTTLSYNGFLGAWETPEMACDGINLRVPNLVIVSCAIVISTACVVIAYQNGQRRKWSIYNEIMLAGPIAYLVEHCLNLYSVAVFYQWEGRPNLAHLPYVFWYLGGLAIAFVQGFRIEFILIAYNRPRRWKPLIVGTTFGLAATLGILSAAMFWLGVTCGIAAVPVHFAIPQLAGYFLTGCMDVILSATVLTICRNSFVVVRALGTTGVTCDAKKATLVRRFMTLNRRLGAIELCVVVVFTSLFFYGTAFGGGYTWGRLSIMGPCLQNLFLLYSVEGMRRA
ncbi:hypothetical protein BDZ88DRAFT_122801 [Geranomyces variabilis]|nr:hypothetical protein BDZ88DRAFT_122801 [Geranomyces variabilis]